MDASKEVERLDHQTGSGSRRKQGGRSRGQTGSARRDRVAKAIKRGIDILFSVKAFRGLFADGSVRQREESYNSIAKRRKSKSSGIYCHKYLILTGMYQGMEYGVLRSEAYSWVLKSLSS